MVDSTFLFVLLFGGALVGLVTSRVRMHTRARTALDIAAGTLGGFAGAPIWLAFVQNVLPHIMLPPVEMRTHVAFLLSDAYYLSPIVGGFLGVGLLSLAMRVFGHRRSQEPWLAWLGELIQIVGIVYLVMAMCLTLALLAAAVHSERWDMLSPGALFIDVVYGGTLTALGWSLARVSRPPA